MVFTSGIQTVTDAEQPDGIFVRNGMQYCIDRACAGHLCCNEFWICRDLYGGSSVFFHKSDDGSSQWNLCRVVILCAAE